MKSHLTSVHLKVYKLWCIFVTWVRLLKDSLAYPVINSKFVYPYFS